MKTYILITILLSFLTTAALAAGNTTNQSFSKAKKILMKDVYAESSQRHTIYCGAVFDEKKNITLPAGFKTDKHLKRSKRVEIEHIVPAENFGRTFSEWRDGHPECIDNKDKSFKGRKCAEKINTEYRYMQSDMFNLYPAIGSVNAMRSNYNFVMLPDGASSFGSCDMQIKENKAQPPENARGMIARSYLYMELTYKRYSMSKSQRQLMSAWDKQHPVTAWECERSTKIEKLQDNLNPVMRGRCK
jgi:deoxyribonuclease-1